MPVRVDPSKIESSSMITMAWQGKPEWVLRRTITNLENLHRENTVRNYAIRIPRLTNSQTTQRMKITVSRKNFLWRLVFVRTWAVCRIMSRMAELMLSTHYSSVPVMDRSSVWQIGSLKMFLRRRNSLFHFVITLRQYFDNGLLEIGSDATTS